MIQKAHQNNTMVDLSNRRPSLIDTAIGNDSCFFLAKNTWHSPFDSPSLPKNTKATHVLQISHSCNESFFKSAKKCLF